MWKACILASLFCGFLSCTEEKIQKPNDNDKSRWERPGSASDKNTCDFVRNILDGPEYLRRFEFYHKYTEAYGIPVIGSEKVQDKSLQRACYVLRFMLADRPDLRQLLYARYARIGIYAISEGMKSLPEYKETPTTLINKKVPSTAISAIVAVPESNLLCMTRDDYLPEDILVRGLGRLIARLTAEYASYKDIWDKIYSYHAYLRKEGYPKWSDTYATKTILDWVAEATQSYFDVNYEYTCPDSFHNYVNTRKELQEYDDVLYQLIKWFYPCENKLYDRCLEGKAPEPKMNCPIPTDNVVIPTKLDIKEKLKEKTGCKDSPWWDCKQEFKKRGGVCSTVMRLYCRATCRNCVDCKDLDHLDHNPKCSGWAAKGFCQTTEDPMASWYIRHICRASCPSN